MYVGVCVLCVRVCASVCGCVGVISLSHVSGVAATAPPDSDVTLTNNAASTHIHASATGQRERESMREKERERDKERESVCERERESVCVCEREREREREKERERERGRESVCVIFTHISHTTAQAVAGRAFGCAPMRFVPKATTMRPIVNMGRLFSVDGCVCVYL